MMRRGILLALFMLAACGGSGEGCVTLAAGSPAWCLLAPAQAPAFEVLSEIEVKRGDGMEVVLAQVENDASSLSAAVLSPLGQRLAWVRWQDGRIQRESMSSRGAFDPAALLALVQLARWPAADLARAAGDQGFEFSESANQRTLRDARGWVLVRILAEGAELRLELPQNDLSLRLRDLPPTGEAQ